MESGKVCAKMDVSSRYHQMQSNEFIFIIYCDV